MSLLLHSIGKSSTILCFPSCALLTEQEGVLPFLILIVCSTVLGFLSSDSEILHARAQGDLDYGNEDLKLVNKHSLATGQAQETTVPEF